MFHVEHDKIWGVIVIGGGHAGVEASLAAARMGARTLLITHDRRTIGVMSCNPSIGGVGKGQLVKEIDALGGEMGKNADATGIHFRRLNTRKGGAVQSSRCQSDKHQYAARLQTVLYGQTGLTIFEGEVKALLAGDGGVEGVEAEGKTSGRVRFSGRQVVITSGTFLQGLLHCGDERRPGGRFGEAGAQGLSENLRRLGFQLLRLKTGTPPRLKRDSLALDKLEPQWGDQPPRRFSFSPTEIALPQVACYLTHTTAQTHAIIADNLARSPLYSGKIVGIGPRYCPSIEDKVVKFPDRAQHPIFLEPESLTTDWIYPNGISTSLPADVQEAFVRAIPGCENAVFLRHGYAVEYDCIDPRQLFPTLESRLVPGLFFGGQVNGTSGYEEAAAQGLLAGINAACRALERPLVTLDRTEAYLGVLADDLVRHGITEPYRMFTSRAEHRLSIREDNADLRLRPIGRRVGLVGDEDFARFEARQEALGRARAYLAGTSVPLSDRVTEWFEGQGLVPPAQADRAVRWLKRPEVGISDVIGWLGEGPLTALDPLSQETVEIEVKYEGYIAALAEERRRLAKCRETALPPALAFDRVDGLSNELREKLRRSRPATLAEAASIPGMTPSGLAALLSHLHKGQHVQP